VNYFEVFELPKALGIDLRELEKKFHELSRKIIRLFHDRVDWRQAAALQMTSNSMMRTERCGIPSAGRSTCWTSKASPDGSRFRNRS
jgi:hypothetical protein